jgi:probable F420-dependent oxidoreductase
VIVDGHIDAAPLDAVPPTALAAQAAGLSAIWVEETAHDPFLPLALAAEHTDSVDLGTCIAVGFARNPMTLATVANDLQVLSAGRFKLGLGTQIKPHIEHRFSMPWSAPAARMREMVLAIRAIWATWGGGERLNFRGEFYQHTLMTPFFDPGPNPFGNPQIFLAAVGERMTSVAGEVADGLFVHGFTTRRYLAEVTLPALAKGLDASGRPRAAVQVSYPGFVVSGRTAAEREASAARVRTQISFYGSTPAYRGVLELEGWGALADRLHELSVGSDPDRWDRMADLVDDEVLGTFAVVAPVDDVARAIRDRFGTLVDRFTLELGPWAGPETVTPVVAALGTVPD